MPTVKYMDLTKEGIRDGSNLLRADSKLRNANSFADLSPPNCQKVFSTSQLFNVFHVHETKIFCPGHVPN